MDFIVDIVKMPALWMYSVFTRSGVFIIWTSAITIVLVFRYIIFPLTGYKTDVFSKIPLRSKEKTGKNNNTNIKDE